MTLKMCGYNTFYITILILVFSILSLNIRRVRKDILWIIIFAIMSIVSETYLVMLYISLITYLSQFVTIKKIASISILSGLIFLVINYILYKYGVTKVESFDLSFKMGPTVSDFGYGNPNMFSLFVLFIILYVYVYIKNMNLYMIGLLLLTSIIIYHTTYSRTIYICCIIFILFCMIQKTRLRYLVYHKYAMLLYPILIMLLIYSLSINYTDYSVINFILSNRLHHAYDVLNNIEFNNLFTGFIEEEDTTVDITYLHFFLTGFVLSFSYFYYLYLKTVLNKKLHSSYIAPLILIYLVMGLVENVIVTTYFLGGIFFWIILRKSASFNEIEK